MWVRDREETPLAYNVSQLVAREVKTFLHFLWRWRRFSSLENHYGEAERLTLLTSITVHIKVNSDLNFVISSLHTLSEEVYGKFCIFP